MPERIQRKRTKGWKMPDGAIYVGRPTKWGNPYHVGGNYADDDLDEDGKEVIGQSWDNISKETAIKFYEDAIANHYPAVKITMAEIILELRGHDLACWCPLDQPCHADVLLRLANQ
jgi:hypothetical protein